MSMEKELTESEVLHELDIPDFRHLSKEKVMTFASMLSKMSPNVAEKAIEQFPEFGKIVIEAFTDYRAVLEKSLDSNKESTKECFEAYDTILETLKKCINGNPSFEEKKYYIEKMIEVANIKSEKDSENKEFIGKVIGICATAAVFAVGISANIITGGKIEIPLLKK